MNRTAFNTRPVLNAISESLILVAMLGMTVAGAAAWASQPLPVVHKLDAVIVTGPAAVVHQLPAVYVVGKRQAS